MNRPDASNWTGFFQLAPEGPLIAALPAYGRALVIVALATLFRLSLESVVEQTVFLVSFVAVLIAAWSCGLPASLLAQTVVVLTEMFVFSDSRPRDPNRHSKPLVEVPAFYVIGSAVALLSEFTHAARERVKSKTNEALAERERLHATLACMGEAVLVTDEQGRITMMNPVAEQMTRQSMAESIGKSLDAVFPIIEEHSRAPGLSPIRRVLTERAAVHCESPLLLQSADGGLLPIKYSAAPMRDPQGQLTGIVVVVHDETERKRTELQLRDADRKKDEFLATLAHELRNPLAPISTGVVLMKMARHDPQIIDDTLATMDRQTRHMVRLIDDLLDVSRITRGKLNLQKTTVDLDDIVKNALDLVRPAFQHSEKRFAVNIPDEQCRFFADPHRLTQVLSNLLDNSAKYTPPGGSITLTADCSESSVAITVRDSGIGIPREMQGRIFEMFTQVNASSPSGPKGLGIGLTLAKSLTEMHGGSITVRSEGINQGSEFTVNLPRVTAEPISEPQSDKTAPDAKQVGGRRVLVVDDNDDAVATLSRIIRLLGHQVFTAKDGREAIEAARNLQPEVILMDLGMPNVDGCQAAKHIRTEPWGQGMILVATTGWGQEDDRRRSREAGFDDHLVKPIPISAVENVLARKTRGLPTT